MVYHISNTRNRIEFTEKPKKKERKLPRTFLQQSPLHPHILYFLSSDARLFTPPPSEKLLYDRFVYAGKTQQIEGHLRSFFSTLFPYFSTPKTRAMPHLPRPFFLHYVCTTFCPPPFSYLF